MSSHKTIKRKLFKAIKDNDIEAVKLAILADERCMYAENKDGETPLHLACFEERFEIAECLLKKGMDVETLDRYGNTPLHDATRNCLPEVARFLLSHGANPYARDDAVSPTYPIDLVVEQISQENGKEVALVFAEYVPEEMLDAVMKLSTDEPAREEIIDWYREHHPEMVMERYVAGPGGL